MSAREIHTHGLHALRTLIIDNDSDKIVKELSSIESIETVTPAWRRSSREAQEILQRCPRTRHGFMARVKLFDYGQFDEQPLLVADFLDKCAELGVEVDRRGYATRSWTYAVECRSAQDVEALSPIKEEPEFCPTWDFNPGNIYHKDR